jgi:acetyltransferase-like isoleucine patch superfamily enzyme
VKGILVYRCFQLQQKLSVWLCSPLMRAYAWLWGVEMANTGRFFGLMRLNRHPTATIKLGHRLVFRSAGSSNTGGLNRRCFLSASQNAILEIGNDCGFSGTAITAQQRITLGDRVMCGANVTIIDSDRHPLDPIARHRGDEGASAPIYIGDDVFLGMNVLVLKGVTIGQGAYIAANSVVTHDIPAHAVAAGHPAKVLRMLS